jgi:hypothetical protein
MEHLSYTTTATTDQDDEEILTYACSDEALEAAAGAERRGPLTAQTRFPVNCC